MTDIVLDVDQIEAAPLPAPSTSRTPVPRFSSSASSTRHSTPTPAPRPRPPAPQRVTRSRTAATASASGSRQLSGVSTTRNLQHHAANTPVKREPSSSLSPPPEINAPGSVETSELSTRTEQPPSLEANLSPAESSRVNASQGTMEPAAQGIPITQTPANQKRSPSPNLADSTTILFSKTQSTTLPGGDSSSTAHHLIAPSLPPKASKKRKPQTPDSASEDEGLPLLSEYMCPICFSAPKSAVITPCGHILCGACLHGATTARAANTQPLCPVCRTPIPGLRFALPEPQSNSGSANQSRPGSLGPNSARARERRSRRRHIPPASRTLANGLSLPTRAEDMVDLDAIVDGNISDDETIDVDKEEENEEILDASRSGVIGLELLTMASL